MTASARPAGGGETRRVLRLLTHFSGGRRLYVLALVMLVFEAVTAVFQPYPLAYLIDFLQGKRAALGFHLPLLADPRSETVAVLTMGLILLTMVNSLGDSLAEIYLARGGRVLGLNLRTTLHAHLQRLSLAFHDQRRTGDMLTRVTSDVTALEDFIVKSVSDLAGSFLVLAGTMAFLFYKSWVVAVIAILIVPLLAGISNHYSQRITTASKRQRAREGDLASAAQEMLTSIRVIQTYGRAEYETERFTTQSRGAMQAALETAGLQARFSWVVAVLESLAISAVVWAGLWLIDRHTITIGTLILFALLIQNMFKPTRKIIREWSTIGKIFASAERIAEVLDRRPVVFDRPDAVVAPRLRGEISFDEVDFAYRPEVEDELLAGSSNRRVVLRKIDFRIQPGKVLALVGHSGAGKSTIAQLIPRLYDPDQGTVRIDGTDVRRFTLDSLRSQISVVLQDTVLFSGTVADNIAYGRADATRDQVVEAAVRANADGFIRELPDGYDTMLGERAINLSGGQRQRIAIARAFVRDAPILILDEPTTGLDAAATEQVLGGLRSLMQNKTTIVITHHLNLISAADWILVVDEGRIVEEGDHQRLLARGGTYARYHAMQAGPMASGDPEPTPPDFEALASPRLHAALPGLGPALDAEWVARQLQEHLLAPRVTVKRCRPGKCLYLGDSGCSVRYEVEVRDQHGLSRELVVLGRVLPDDASVDAYRRALVPVAAALDGRGTSLATPYAVLPGRLVVHPFPVDPELPTLVAATDLDRVVRLLGDVGVEPAVGTVAAAHYGRRHRCVVRYELDGTGRDRRTVYGKVRADDRGQLAADALRALDGRLAGVAVPRLYRYVPELRLSLLEALPGAPALARELRRSGGEPERLVDDAARAAAALHGSQVPLGDARTMEGELAELCDLVLLVRRISPELAATLAGLLEVIVGAASATDAMPLGPSHGDFTPSQLLSNGRGCGLVDFDSLAQAEPALDLGQYRAYLRLAVAKAGVPGGADLASRLAARFLSTYLAVAAPGTPPAALAGRVKVYECVSLFRTTVHAWQKLKAGRARTVFPILAQEAACLSSRS